MYIDQLIARLHQQLDILGEKRDSVEQAAQVIAEAMRSKHVIWIHGIGHSMEMDFFNRAGGLAAVRKFSWNFSLDQKISDTLEKERTAEGKEAPMSVVEFAVRSSLMRPGDVLLVGSVSGRTASAVELARCCRELGMKVIAFTSMEYCTKSEAGYHAKGYKLQDFTDIVLDLSTPYGDATMEIEGYDHKVIPFSGIGSLVLGWMVWGRVMEIMGQDAEVPVTFMSVNGAGGAEAYAKAVEKFNNRGF